MCLSECVVSTHSDNCYYERIKHNIHGSFCIKLFLLMSHVMSFHVYNSHMWPEIAVLHSIAIKHFGTLLQKVLRVAERPKTCRILSILKICYMVGKSFKTKKIPILFLTSTCPSDLFVLTIIFSKNNAVIGKESNCHGLLRFYHFSQKFCEIDVISPTLQMSGPMPRVVK